MDDKVFELIEKMYADLKGEIKTVGNQVSKLGLSIEHEIKPDIKALLDGYKQLAEGQEAIESQLVNVTTKIDKQEVEMTIIKGGKNRSAF